MPVIIPAQSALYARLRDLASTKRVVVFAGLPGVGKSLLLQQLALMARDEDRRPHSFQWDVVRASFETPELLADYPERDGFTHREVIARVGAWLRGAIARWQERYPDPSHILIGEAALVGGRLAELTLPSADAVEPLLAGTDTVFVVPVPSRSVRSEIEQRRQRTSTEPQHVREVSDARPNVLQGLWEECYHEAGRLGLARIPLERSPIPYDPDVYRALYRYWLRHRNVEILEIDECFNITGSVYDIAVMESELRMQRPAGEKGGGS